MSVVKTGYRCMPCQILDSRCWIKKKFSQDLTRTMDCRMFCYFKCITDEKSKIKFEKDSRVKLKKRFCSDIMILKIC
jgi:hypothetical protein